MRKNKYFKLFDISLLKTLYINFKCLPAWQAIKLPIILYKKTKIASLKGTVEIDGVVRFGMIQFNYINDEFVGSHHWHRIQIDGKVVFKGKIDFGVGAVLFVRETGRLSFGNNILIGGKTRILCEESIAMGDNIRIAHESQVMDSNFHYIRNTKNGDVSRCTAPIKIGNNIWIGNRCTLMKGTNIPDFTIVGSNSLLNKNYTKDGNHVILGGSPARKIADGYERIFDLDLEEKYNQRFGRLF